MTEAEAKTQDCIGPPNCGAQTEGRRRLCIGSACGMAWRWIPKAGTTDNKPNYYAGPWKGYCGLAAPSDVVGWIILAHVLGIFLGVCLSVLASHAGKP